MSGRGKIVERRINGFCGLIILSLCFIVTCLFYVELCRDVSSAVNNPFRNQYWQIRQIALDWRNPEAEARQSFENGETSFYQLFHGSSVHKKLTGSRGKVATGGFSFAFVKTSYVQPTNARRAYEDARDRFAVAYNREMRRLTRSGATVSGRVR